MRVFVRNVFFCYYWVIAQFYLLGDFIMTKKQFLVIADSLLAGLNATRGAYEKQFYGEHNIFNPTTIELTRIKGVGYKMAITFYIGKNPHYTPVIVRNLDNALERLAGSVKRELEMIAGWTLESI